MRPTRLTFCIMLVATAVIALLAQQAVGQEPSDDAAWQRYQHILSTSTLEWLAQPFLLKADFQLYDLDGNPAEKGSADESWTETGGKRIRIQSPSLMEGDTTSPGQQRAHSRESYLVHQALNAIVRPFPSLTMRKDFAMEAFHQAVSGVDLSCFSLVPSGRPRTAISEAYCMDADNHVLAMTGQLFVIQRSDLRRFHDHEIPIDLTLFYEGRPALTMHVTELDPLPSPTIAHGESRARPSSIRILGEALSGLNLTRKNPDYPKEARKKHIAGSVLLWADISKQGTIEDIEVIASPSPLLTKASMDAVRSWTYSPYLLNGVPTEVETTITVNFAMGK